MIDVQELKNKVIEQGIASLNESETGVNLQGGLLGFEICKTLDTVEDCEEALKDRRTKEVYDEVLKASADAYWEYRYATLQIEYWYEILKVHYDHSPLSARAVLKYAELTGIKKIKT